MPGSIEEGSRVATGFIGVMRKEPLSLALVVMNICLLIFFWVMLKAVAAQREREVGLLYADKREVHEMLTKCIATGQEQRRGDTTTPPFPFMHRAIGK